MRKGFLLFLFSALFAKEQFLSKLKLEEFLLKEKESYLGSKKLRDSWIKPLNITYLYQKGDQFPNQQLESFVIGIDQPIFKSGGILKAIRYANLKGEKELLALKLSKKELIAKVLELLYTYKKLKLQIQKQHYLINNARLNLLIKEEQYRNNEIDSTFLDNAILEKNNKELTLLNLKQNLIDVIEKIKVLSDLNPEEVKLPTLRLIPKREFLAKNLSLKKSHQEVKTFQEYKALTLTKYLPQVSLKANYYYQKMEGSLYFPQYSYKDHYTTYGIGVRIPLADINLPKELQLAKIKLLKAKNSLYQTYKEMKEKYKTVFNQLNLLQQKKKLTTEDQKLYKRILHATKESFKAGEKTEFDVKIMENSLKIKSIEEKIYSLEEQILLLNLYKVSEDGTF